MQSIISLLYIGLGGFLGAISRWGLGNTIKKMFNDGNFPFSTLIINLLGCFGIGLACAIWENNNNARLLPNGNFGIGTGNPEQLLDVEGTIRGNSFDIESLADLPVPPSDYWHLNFKLTSISQRVLTLHKNS